MAPAYVANMSPPLVKYWRAWNRPISPRWLGGHKTVVGFAAGLLGAIATTSVQHVIGYTADIVDYDRWLELGLRFGLGYYGFATDLGAQPHPVTGSQELGDC